MFVFCAPTNGSITIWKTMMNMESLTLTQCRADKWLMVVVVVDIPHTKVLSEGKVPVDMVDQVDTQQVDQVDMVDLDLDLCIKLLLLIFVSFLAGANYLKYLVQHAQDI
mmetsp:Transcript_16090/g.20612  ORF Transcript_16090/g.20612 Transcript_16090/m.20612 type:complete len:109 (-) Transcript_16090:198-524(-)